MSAKRQVSWLALVVLAGVPSHARAQAPADPPRLTVAASFGQVRPLATAPIYGYLPPLMPHSATSWAVAAQLRINRHLLIDGAASGWQYSGSEPSLDVTIDHQATNRTMVVSAIATAAFGRIRVSSGVGIGLAAVSTSSVEHNTHNSLTDTLHLSYSGAAVQGVLALDVPIAARLIIFTSYRLVLPFTPGLADASLSAGVRFVIK